MPRRIAALWLVAILLVPQHLSAWGVEGHTWINTIAIQKLPKSVPLFLRLASARIGWLGPEPDRWRNVTAEPELKYSQEADHFLDWEALPEGFEFPRDRHQYIAKLYELRAAALAKGMDPKKADELLPERIGYQPYIAMEVLGRLRVAFREYRHAKAEKRSTRDAEQNAIFYAGWLGHYVGDASQPLHVTLNYDGWVQPNPNGYRTQKGIHWDFESRFVKATQSQKEIAALVHAPQSFSDHRKAYFDYMKTSLGHVEKLYQLEKAGGFKDQGSPEAREFTRQRLAAGAQMLADLIYTAWMESATDPPDPYAPKPATSVPRR